MNSTVVILCIVGAILAFGGFLNYMGGIGKSFQTEPSSISINATKLKNQQHDTAEETNRKQKELMDDMRQKMQDNARMH